jgi:hypothetical protein
MTNVIDPLHLFAGEKDPCFLLNPDPDARVFDYQNLKN